ncbi:hypothetical protein OL233_03455 [Vagococcus sp. PNs007]|uniref:PglD N-terminal domain-containing protein n=1 Tax=Vagococcus proximus TaxID=2991417 RepID=A0ABT5X0D7_9ENTE|nr:hypothetical protein [Vagococcus proximus]MDF0479336.1 hypothetical protein [Vagococcus proximus]
MKDLIIIGAGGLGRKVFVCLKRLNQGNLRWNIKGFIDDDLNSLDNVRCDLKIIGSIKDYQPKPNDVFVLAMSNPDAKEKMADMFLERGAVFETIVSPDVLLGDYVEIGLGSIVMTPYNIESGAKIGKFVTILGSTLALDGQIGDYSTTTGFANLTNANIGKKVFVGSHAVILEGLNIGDESSVGVGSIVMKDVNPGTKVFGNPAREYK